MKVTVTIEPDSYSGAAARAEAKLYAEFLEEVGNLYLHKNEAYGSAWKAQGWMGNLARIFSKAARLKVMCWNAEPVDQRGDESVNDTLLDLANLSLFALMNRRGGNRWGY